MNRDMVQMLTAGHNSTQSTRKGRGRARLFPVIDFASAISLPQNILDYGVDGEIERIMLFDKIGRSPDSAQSKYLVRTSAKYGLTEGGNTSSFLKVTEDGRLALGDPNTRRTAEKRFHLAIGQFEPFASLYGKLRNQRLQDVTVLGAELGIL